MLTERDEWRTWHPVNRERDLDRAAYLDGGIAAAMRDLAATLRFIEHAQAAPGFEALVEEKMRCARARVLPLLDELADAKLLVAMIRLVHTKRAA